MNVKILYIIIIIFIYSDTDFYCQTIIYTNKISYLMFTLVYPYKLYKL